MHLFVRTGACFLWHLENLEYLEYLEYLEPSLNTKKENVSLHPPFQKLECQLSFKFERILNADDIVLEFLVGAHPLLHLLATMEHRGVVAPGDEFSDS